jgi:hypothetical protein
MMWRLYADHERKHDTGDATLTWGLDARRPITEAHYRDPNPLPPAVEQAVAEDWADDLGEYPAWAVEEACRRWRRDPKKYRYKPLPGDIRRLCEEVVAKGAAMADRLRRLLAATEAGKSAHEGGGAADVRSRVAALAAAKRLP